MARPELFTDEISEIGAVFDLVRRGRPAWQKDALCKEYPLLTWFPVKGDDSLGPKRICQRCLVVNECGAWAMQQDLDLDGIWGGFSRADRSDQARPAGGMKGRLNGEEHSPIGSVSNSLAPPRLVGDTMTIRYTDHW